MVLRWLGFDLDGVSCVVYWHTGYDDTFAMVWHDVTFHHHFVHPPFKVKPTFAME